MKMLLVGDINETLYSLNNYLMADFQIQICSENMKNVKDMIRLFRPSIVVILVNEMNKEIEDVFSMISVKYNTMPLLIISTTELRTQIEEGLGNFKNKRIIYRPVASSKVKKECLALLNNEDVENDEADLAVKKKNILVVDDNALVLRHIKSLLESEYQIILANSGKKALAILRKNPVDLVLLDYEMPGMNGREVFECIIRDEKLKDIPVVFLTSVAQREQIYSVLKNVPFGYILKPPANEKILSVIKEALG